MKKARLLALLLVLCALFPACGKSEKEPDPVGTDRQSIPEEITTEAAAETEKKRDDLGKSGLKKGAVILFAGDSITDMYRQNQRDPESLGAEWNFVNRINDYLQEHFPEDKLKIYNTGISGMTVAQYCVRLKERTYQLKPDYLFIELGTNNAWNETDKELSAVRAEYEAMLDEIEKNSNAKIILVQPYLFKTGDKKARVGALKLDDCIERMDAIGDFICQIAAERGYPMLFFKEIFSQAMKQYDVKYKDFSDDYIHPNAKGYEILTDAMLTEMGITGYKPVYTFDFSKIREKYGIPAFEP